jgi:hypothetical protein
VLQKAKFNLQPCHCLVPLLVKTTRKKNQRSANTPEFTTADQLQSMSNVASSQLHQDFKVHSSQSQQYCEWLSQSILPHTYIPCSVSLEDTGSNVEQVDEVGHVATVPLLE